MFTIYVWKSIPHTRHNKEPSPCNITNLVRSHWMTFIKKNPLSCIFKIVRCSYHLLSQEVGHLDIHPQCKSWIPMHDKKKWFWCIREWKEMSNLQKCKWRYPSGNKESANVLWNTIFDSINKSTHQHNCEIKE